MESAITVITEFYGDRKAERSQVPLINHITEGHAILDILCASYLTYGAFSIHPIVQCKEEGFEYLEDYPEYNLALEYSDRANAYLCKPENDFVDNIEDVYGLVGDMSKDCRDMLIADKLQNRKDFMLHHFNTHSRSSELAEYFDLWLAFLFSDIWKP